MSLVHYFTLSYAVYNYVTRAAGGFTYREPTYKANCINVVCVP